MVFITNNLAWSARSVCDLYRRRWDIEVFFKQVKQSLKLSNFLGHSANAVRWQVYTALLVYVLLRFAAFCSDWGTQFHAALCRGALDVVGALGSGGVAARLWDSSGAFPHPRLAPRGVVARTGPGES